MPGIPRKNINIGVWLTCQNPNCCLPDRKFLVDYYGRDRQFCSRSCKSSIPRSSVNGRNPRIGAWLICQNPSCPLPDKAFLATYSNRDQKYCSRSCGRTVEMLKKNQDSEFFVKSREAMLACWEDSEFREKIAASRKTLEVREAQRESMKRNWQDPEFAAKSAKASSEAMKDLWQNPEFVTLHTEAHRTPQARSNHAAHAKKQMKKRWEDNPDFVDYDV